MTLSEQRQRFEVARRRIAHKKVQRVFAGKTLETIGASLYYRVPCPLRHVAFDQLLTMTFSEFAKQCGSGYSVPWTHNSGVVHDIDDLIRLMDRIAECSTAVDSSNASEPDHGGSNGLESIRVSFNEVEQSIVTSPTKGLTTPELRTHIDRREIRQEESETHEGGLPEPSSTNEKALGITYGFDRPESNGQAELDVQGRGYEEQRDSLTHQDDSLLMMCDNTQEELNAPPVQTLHEFRDKSETVDYSNRVNPDELSERTNELSTLIEKLSITEAALEVAQNQLMNDELRRQEESDRRLKLDRRDVGYPHGEEVVRSDPSNCREDVQAVALPQSTASPEVERKHIDIREALSRFEEDHRVNDDAMEAEFESLRSVLVTHVTHRLLDEEIREFLEPKDAEVPIEFLSSSVREVLETPFNRFTRRWVSRVRVQCLLDLLKRAVVLMHSRTGCRNENEMVSGRVIRPRTTSVARNIDDDGSSWRTWCEIILSHGMERLMLGTIAECLRDLPRTLWNQPLTDFTSLTYCELSEKSSVGPKTIQTVIAPIRGFALDLVEIPHSTNIGIKLWPGPLHRVQEWMECLLESREVPSVDDVAIQLLRPLVCQLQHDLPERQAEISIQRLRLSRSSGVLTLDELAEIHGISRERIRQIELVGQNVLQVRFPQGRRLLETILRFLVETNDAEKQVEMMQQVALSCFKSEISPVHTHDVCVAWEKAGRNKLTPMNAEQIQEWISRNFPEGVPPSAAEGIQSEFPSCQVNGRRVWFSDTDTDRILRMLFESGKPARLGELVLADLVLGEQDATDTIAFSASDARDERNLWGKIKRDPRIVELDDHRIMPAEHCGFSQADGEWFVRLEPDDPLGHALNRLPLSQISSLLINGMLQHCIADATAVGSHRFVNESLLRLFGSQLPSTLTPNVLADMLVLDSNGMIRPMRRRRLRWDSVDERLRARGKREWVGFVVAEAAQPMLLPELVVALRHYYQDYADYVIRNIHIAMDDEGEADDRVQFLSNLGHRIPVLVVPTAWELNADGSNVSDGVLRLALQLRVRVNAGRMGLSELSPVPWLENLVSSQDVTDSHQEAGEVDEFSIESGTFAQNLNRALDEVFYESDVSGDCEQMRAERQAGIVPTVNELVSQPVLDADGIRALHNGVDASRLFAPDGTETSEDRIAYAFDRIVQALPTIRPRSLAELALTSDDVEWLKELFETISAQDIRRFLASPSRFSDFSSEAQFGVVLLLLDSELARRHAIGGTLWAAIHRQINLRPGAQNLLFAHRQPTARHRACLEAAARELGLRCAFGEDSAQEWYQLVCLQFGFSLPDLARRLPEWLSGYHPPVSVTRLLHDARHASESFQLLWETLLRYRQGHVDQAELREILESSPWVLPEWIDLLVDKCREATTVTTDARRETAQSIETHGTGEDEGEDSALAETFVSLPRAVLQDGTLRFQCLVEAQASNATELEDVYDLAANGRTLSTLLRQPDGSLLAQPGVIELPTSSASVEVELRTRSGEVVAVQSVELWADDDDVDGYVVRSGRRISPWGADFAKRETLLFYSSDLRSEPSLQPVTTLGNGSRRVVHLEAGTEVRLLLEGQVLWENRRPDSPKWRELANAQLEFRPRESPREFRVRVSHPVKIRATALRYRRRLLEFDHNSDRVSVSPWLPLERDLQKSETVPFTVVLRMGDETAEVRCRRRFRLPGQHWQWSDMWEAVPASASCDAVKLNDVPFRLAPPGGGDNAHQWHVFEGRRWVTSVEKRSQRITDLDGWGAPLTLRSGPYNSVERDQPLLRSIVNHGVLHSVNVMTDGAVRISLARRIEPDERHDLVLLDDSGRVLRVPIQKANTDPTVATNLDSTAFPAVACCSWSSDFDVADGNTSSVWHALLPDETDSERIVAVGIAYDGEWLGSRWADHWFRLLDRPADVEADSFVVRWAEDVSDALRWFRLPLLSPDRVERVRKFAHAFAVPVLSTWLGCRRDGQLSPVILDEGWLGVTRTIFKDWQPSGNDTIALDARLNDSFAHGTTLPLSVAVSKLCQVHPLLAARVVQTWLKSQENVLESAKDRRALPVALRLQILAGSDDNQLVRRVAQDVARLPEPPDGTLDFVNDPRDGLLVKALALFEDTDRDQVTEIDRGNIEVAMRLDAFRTLLLSMCLERIGKELR